jgi:serine O-acetyltransferase
MDITETPFQKIRADLNVFARNERRPVTLMFALRMFLLTPGFQFVFSRRLQEIVVRVPLVGRLLRRIVWWASCLCFSSEIALAAEVGGGLYTPHPFGIVIGTARVGRDVTILQNVTIGHAAIDSTTDPVIGDGARLFAGAVILGEITLGRNCIVGANSVLLQSVPDNATAIGAPARILLKDRAPSEDRTSIAATPESPIEPIL